MVSFDRWQLYQRVAVTIATEHIWERWLADFTLELSPVDTCVVNSGLTILLGLQPTFDAVEMYILTSTSAFANLEQWVDLIKLAVPAQSTLRQIIILRLNDSTVNLVILLLRLFTFFAVKWSRASWFTFSFFLSRFLYLLQLTISIIDIYCHLRLFNRRTTLIAPILRFILLFLFFVLL